VVGNLGVQGATTVEDVTATSVTTADFEATGDVTVQGQVWTGAWLDFNPNWNCEAGSSPDVGNGTLTARYIQVGKTVHFQITLVAGTTTTFGNSTSGFWRFNLPVAPRMESVAYVLCRDFNSGNRFTGACELSTAITNGVLRVNAPVDGSNGSVHYQNPFVWTTSDTMRISGTSTLNTVNAGDISAGSLSSTGDIETDGDVYAHGLAVARLVKGKVHTGSLVDTSTTSDSYQNISSANIQNVPVIAGHAYKAEFQVAVTSSVANDRIRYSLWNGTVGGTQCGAIIPIVRAEAASTFRVQTFSFIWEAPSTETISNLNLAMLRFSGTGSVQTRVESSSYYGLVYDLGPSGVITNL
jgi:hypothetical protein